MLGAAGELVSQIVITGRAPMPGRGTIAFAVANHIWTAPLYHTWYDTLAKYTHTHTHTHTHTYTQMFTKRVSVDGYDFHYIVHLMLLLFAAYLSNCVGFFFYS